MGRMNTVDSSVPGEDSQCASSRCTEQMVARPWSPAASAREAPRATSAQAPMFQEHLTTSSEFTASATASRGLRHAGRAAATRSVRRQHASGAVPHHRASVELGQVALAYEYEAAGLLATATADPPPEPTDKVMAERCAGFREDPAPRPAGERRGTTSATGRGRYVALLRAEAAAAQNSAERPCWRPCAAPGTAALPARPPRSPAATSPSLLILGESGTARGAGAGPAEVAARPRSLPGDPLRRPARRAARSRAFRHRTRGGHRGRGARRPARAGRRRHPFPRRGRRHASWSCRPNPPPAQNPSLPGRRPPPDRHRRPFPGRHHQGPAAGDRRRPAPRDLYHRLAKVAFVAASSLRGLLRCSTARRRRRPSTVAPTIGRRGVPTLSEPSVAITGAPAPSKRSAIAAGSAPGASTKS